MSLPLNNLSKLGILTALGIYGTYKCVFTGIFHILFIIKLFTLVEAGHQGLIFSRFSGLRPDIFREGWHLRIPYFETPVLYDVRTKPRVIQTITSNRGIYI